MSLTFIVALIVSVFRKDCSPGPGYFIEASITRGGKDGTPVYSILGRQKDPSKYFWAVTTHSKLQPVAGYCIHIESTKLQSWLAQLTEMILLILSSLTHRVVLRPTLLLYFV